MSYIKVFITPSLYKHMMRYVVPVSNLKKKKKLKTKASQTFFTMRLNNDILCTLRCAFDLTVVLTNAMGQITRSVSYPSLHRIY